MQLEDMMEPAKIAEASTALTQLMKAMKLHPGLADSFIKHEADVRSILYAVQLIPQMLSLLGDACGYLAEEVHLYKEVSDPTDWYSEAEILRLECMTDLINEIKMFANAVSTGPAPADVLVH